MNTNTIFFGWNRSIPGRERASASHFEEFVQYLNELQQNNTLESYDIVFLTPHSGNMNGFFLLRGESGNLDTLLGSKEWVTHVTRASLHLDEAGVVRGYTGKEVMEQMNLWTESIPG